MWSVLWFSFLFEDEWAGELGITIRYQFHEYKNSDILSDSSYSGSLKYEVVSSVTVSENKKAGKINKRSFAQQPWLLRKKFTFEIKNCFTN